jgi:hypothetical protein
MIALTFLGGRNKFLRVLVFKDIRDDVDEAINFLKTAFPLIQFIEIDNNTSDWKQLLIMSQCVDNIIANSSFSWFGAFFNVKNNSRVVYPSKWLASGTTPEDLCPPQWIKVEVSLLN